jgi:hypothetical protein
MNPHKGALARALRSILAGLAFIGPAAVYLVLS